MARKSLSGANDYNSDDDLNSENLEKVIGFVYREIVDEAEKTGFLSVCYATADQILVNLGFEPCSSVWVKPSFKTERERIIAEMVKIRGDNPSDSVLYQDTYRALFMLNAKFLIGQSSHLTKNLIVNNKKDALESAFASFYMEGFIPWGKYDPSKGSFTNYMCNLKHKVRSASQELPSEMNSNQIYDFRRIDTCRQEILREIGGPVPDMKNRLKIKTGYSDTVINQYFQYEAQKNPVHIETLRLDENAEVNIPVSESEKVGKSHLLTPEEATIENATKSSIMDFIDNIIHEEKVFAPDEHGAIKDFMLALLDGANIKKAAEMAGMDKSYWVKLRKLISKEPNKIKLSGIINIPAELRDSKVTKKAAETVRMDETSFNEDDDEECSDIRINWEDYCKAHNLS